MYYQKQYDIIYSNKYNKLARLIRVLCRTGKIVNQPELELIWLSFSILQTLEFSFGVEWGGLEFQLRDI